MAEQDFDVLKDVPNKVLIVDVDGEPVPPSLPVDPLTDAELRASPVPVSGPITDAQLRAAAVPVSGPLTDAQLRAAAVPVSLASQPLPAGASTEATLLLVAKATDITTLINAAYNAVAPVVIPVATTTFNVAVDPKFPHTFLGIIPCNSAGTYTASATGSAAITVESVNCPGVLQTPSESVINMNAPADVSFGGNLLSVRGTVTGLTSTHYRVCITQNKA